MDVHHPASKTWTVDEFLPWAEAREGKYELVRGTVVMMTGGTRRHAELRLALASFLRSIVLAAGYGAATEWGVPTLAGMRYPDVVVVYRRDGDGRELATPSPVFVAEILSPPSLAIDFNEKAAEYTAIASLAHCLVLAQDEPRVWLWSRNAEGRFGTAQMIAGAQEVVPLPGLGASLPLAEIYRGIA